MRDYLRTTDGRLHRRRALRLDAEAVAARDARARLAKIDAALRSRASVHPEVLVRLKEAGDRWLEVAVASELDAQAEEAVAYVYEVLGRSRGDLNGLGYENRYELRRPIDERTVEDLAIAFVSLLVEDGSPPSAAAGSTGSVIAER